MPMNAFVMRKDNDIVLSAIPQTALSTEFDYIVQCRNENNGMLIFRLKGFGAKAFEKYLRSCVKEMKAIADSDRLKRKHIYYIIL